MKFTANTMLKSKRKAPYQDEIDALKKGDLIIVTRDYLTTGIYYVKFYKDNVNRPNPKGLHCQNPILVIPVTCDENDIDACEEECATLYKPDWHTNSQDAFRQVAALTLYQQMQLVTKQQEAMEFLFGDKPVK